MIDDFRKLQNKYDKAMIVIIENISNEINEID